MKRKLLAAGKDLVRQVSELAKKKNLTLYSLVNETLEQPLKVKKAGESLPKTVQDYAVLKIAKEDQLRVHHVQGRHHPRHHSLDLQKGGVKER